MLILLFVSAIYLLGRASSVAALDARGSYDRETGKLKVTYRGARVLECVVSFGGKEGRSGVGAGSVEIETNAMAVEPVSLGYGHGPPDSGKPPAATKAESLIIRIKPTALAWDHARIEGTVLAGSDALACITDGGPEMVRGCLGPSNSLLNRGVFDRRGDWVLSIDEPDICEIHSLVPEEEGSRFALKAHGNRLTLRFKESYYRHHLGYLLWTPESDLWENPICGWCSWAAYRGGINEEQMVQAAEFFATKLKDYGYTVIQMDDGYQRLSQGGPEQPKPGDSMADRWARPNDKFPHGLAWLARQISQRGLTPGIWVGSYLPLGLDPSWYVEDAPGQPHKGEWVSYAIDGLNKDAVDAAFLKTIRALKKQGWDYFKIDTIRHVLYDSYQRVPEYWARRHEDANEAFRQLFTAIKREIGPKTYMLSCWGAIPQMAGIPDGCRVGEDVDAGWGSACKSANFASRFQYLNNIIWRNDPDYMCLRWPLTVTEARSWATFVAMLGGQLMVSDPPSAYDADRLEIMRKVAPPLMIRPTTLRPLKGRPELWLVEIDQCEAPYVVLARIAFDKPGLAARALSLADIGLDVHQTYLAWDFWNEKFLGELHDTLPMEPIGEGDCRVYCLRPKLDHPQVVSTNRHIGQGAQELRNLSWQTDELSGELRIPSGTTSSIFVHVPERYQRGQVLPSSGVVEQAGRILRLTLANSEREAIPWSVRFTHSKNGR